MKKLILFFLLIYYPFFIFSKNPEILSIHTNIDKQHLQVSFSMEKDFANQDLLDAINSTNEVSFTYEAELLKKKIMLPDKSLLKMKVRKSVQFDNLTKQYEVKVYYGEEVKEKFVLTSLDEVLEELSGVKDLDLGVIVDLEPGERVYYIRVKITLLKSFFLWIFPRDVDTGWKEQDIKTP